LRRGGLDGFRFLCFDGIIPLDPFPGLSGYVCNAAIAQGKLSVDDSLGTFGLFGLDGTIGLDPFPYLGYDIPEWPLQESKFAMYHSLGKLSPSYAEVGSSLARVGCVCGPVS